MEKSAIALITDGHTIFGIMNISNKSCFKAYLLIQMDHRIVCAFNSVSF